MVVTRVIMVARGCQYHRGFPPELEAGLTVREKKEAFKPHGENKKKWIITTRRYPDSHAMLEEPAYQVASSQPALTDAWCLIITGR